LTLLGSLQRSSDFLAGFKGPASNGRGGTIGREKGKEGGGGEKRTEEEGHFIRCVVFSRIGASNRSSDDVTN